MDNLFSHKLGFEMVSESSTDINGYFHLLWLTQALQKKSDIQPFPFKPFVYVTCSLFLQLLCVIVLELQLSHAAVQGLSLRHSTSISFSSASFPTGCHPEAHGI